MCVCVFECVCVCGGSLRGGTSIETYATPWLDSTYLPHLVSYTILILVLLLTTLIIDTCSVMVVSIYIHIY